jgi:hypothetical protein
MKKIISLLGILVVCHLAFGQMGAKYGVNYDESKVPEFELPDPLVSFNGTVISDSALWFGLRRPELLDFFTRSIYGKVPGELQVSGWKVLEQSDHAMNGKARRKQVELQFEKNGRSLQFTVLLYLPKSRDKAPLFLGYNFYGNHTIAKDEDIIISKAWARNNGNLGIVNNRLTGESRGASSGRWAIEKIIDAGYGLATIYYGEVDPDNLANDFSDGIHPLLYSDGQQRPADDEWGAITAWAWGLSRTMDYLESDNDVDPGRVIVFGHSRLGKTALWAGANDERFAAVISNNSGCLGAALSKRKFGETISIINNNQHWFCMNVRQYNSNEESLPVDQHELIALIAPRPVYIASAEEDLWADPRGEFLSAYYATPVYKLLGKSGIPSKEMPAVNQPIQHTVAYHIRSGKHDVTDYDWEQYIKWANRQLIGKD